MKPTTILIADNDPLFRNGLIAILKSFPEFRTVGGAATTEEALKKLSLLQPYVIIIDSCLPGGNITKTTSWIKQKYACTRVIVVAASNAMDNLPDVIEAGADGYLVKGHLSIKEIIETINPAGSGEYSVSAANRIASV
jgi:DNA-binding NarL/FixJ family response regulator